MKLFRSNSTTNAPRPTSLNEAAKNRPRSKPTGGKSNTSSSSSSSGGNSGSVPKLPVAADITKTKKQNHHPPRSITTSSSDGSTCTATTAASLGSATRCFLRAAEDGTTSLGTPPLPSSSWSATRSTTSAAAGDAGREQQQRRSGGRSVAFASTTQSCPPKAAPSSTSKPSSSTRATTTTAATATTTGKKKGFELMVVRTTLQDPSDVASAMSSQVTPLTAADDDGQEEASAFMQDVGSFIRDCLSDDDDSDDDDADDSDDDAKGDNDDGLRAHSFTERRKVAAASSTGRERDQAVAASTDVTDWGYDYEVDDDDDDDEVGTTSFSVAGNSRMSGFSSAVGPMSVMSSEVFDDGDDDDYDDILRGRMSPVSSVVDEEEEEEEAAQDDSASSEDSLQLGAAGGDGGGAIDDIERGRMSPFAFAEDGLLGLAAVDTTEEEVEGCPSAYTALPRVRQRATQPSPVRVLSSNDCLPVLYLGPVDVRRPVRYRSLSNCVDESLTMHFTSQLMHLSTDGLGDGGRDTIQQSPLHGERFTTLLLSGPAPPNSSADEVMYDPGLQRKKTMRGGIDAMMPETEQWAVRVPIVSTTHDTSAAAADEGADRVSSGRSQSTPVDMDDMIIEVNCIEDVRDVHAGICRKLEAGQFEEVLAILADSLLPSLRLSQQQQQQQQQQTDAGLSYEGLAHATVRNIGILQLHTGQHSDAIQSLLEVTRQNPNDLVSFVFIGLTMCAMNELEDASHIFLEALLKIEKHPGVSNDKELVGVECQERGVGVILNNLGCCFLKRREFEKAKSIFQRAKDSFLTDPRGESGVGSMPLGFTLCNLAKTLVQTKNYDLAIETLDMAIDVFRSIPDLDQYFTISTMNAKALICASVQKFASALKTYEEILDMLELDGDANAEEVVQILEKMKPICKEIRHTKNGASCLNRIRVRQKNLSQKGSFYTM